ncbi:AI-2E family transporter [Agromyces aurantiacus]|uniref:AI-2E family transporter n=1 Tax=Agromyces aurantiacus TaxID=165814 RepID=A0ABV9R9Z5_9MICO|nr:AI-2E family transporter [Agromyces aurantiacus]MBM7504556.1 putative PurR-regulated permease PerM [Agromyces aurantiacus]
MARHWWHRGKSAPEARRGESAAPSAAIATPHEWALPRATVVLLGIAAAVVVTFGLWAARGVVAPVFFAVVLTICVHPARRWLEGRGVPRGLATASAILAVFALLAGFFAILLIGLAQFTSLLPQYAPQIQTAAQNLANALASIGFGQEQVDTILSGLEPSRAVDVVTAILGGISGIVFGLVVVITLVILMAMDATYVPAILRGMQPRRPALVVALAAYGRNVRRYMVVTTALGLAQGVLNWLALLILQVPGAMLWGLLSFICSFIPNIGYFIAIIPPLVFGFLSGGWPTVIGVIVVYGIVNAVVQSIIQPKVVGKAVQLSESITFASVLFWALVIGPIGAILAVPLTLLGRTILIDADPSIHWWRPATGDVAEAKLVAAELVAENRAQSKAQRAEKGERRRGR